MAEVGGESGIELSPAIFGITVHARLYHIFPFLYCSLMVGEGTSRSADECGNDDGGALGGGGVVAGGVDCGVE